MSKKNIYFFRLKIIQTLLVNGTLLKENLKKEEVYEYIENLYNDLPTNANGLKYLKHDITSNEYFLIEFLDFDKKSTFVRLGKPSPNNEVGKRNVVSCNLIDIPLENAELIESYTYMYIDFETDVISFLRVGSAPSVKWFAITLNYIKSTSGYNIECDPFMTDDILNSYSSNAQVGSISITTIKPTAEISMILGGITESHINDLDSSEMSLTISIKPSNRGGNTTSSKKTLASIFKIAKESDEELRRFTVNIADELDEKKKVIDLMKYRFTRTSNIASDSKLTTEQYKQEIIKVYRRELMNLKKLFEI